MVRIHSALRAPARALAALALAALAPGGVARAEGLVQLAFFGSIQSPGGALVDVAVGMGEGERTRELRLSLHLAVGTTASDFAALLGERLRRASFDVIEPSHPGPVASLFVDRVRYVETRLGHGLRGSVTTSQEAPSRVHVRPPPVATEDAALLVGISTWRAHTSEGGRETLEVVLPADASAASISEQLATRGIEAGWVCERPSLDSWRPSRTIDGRDLTGCSIELSTREPWHLRVELASEQR